jgi:alpha-L-fucosidase
MKKYLINVCLGVLAAITCLQGNGQKVYTADWASLDSRPVPAWFQDAKFGIFIHWGIYSVPAWAPTKGHVYDKYAEWYWAKQEGDKQVNEAFRAHHQKMYGDKVQYPDFVRDFKAELFNPADWAALFKQAGAKYVVLTSKHHDGFALWPSTESWNWNSMDVGPHRDLAGDLMRAVKEKGLRMGYYYSLYEWYNPLYKKDVNRYVNEHMLPQMKDLVVRYKPDVVWTDGEWGYESATWKSQQFLSWLYNESPVKEEVVVNDRWGKETRGKHGGFYTTEYDLAHEQNVADAKITHPWEECRGIGGSFGYNRSENLEDYATAGQLIRVLVEKVARGGNLLLNIGPAADGTIPVIMQQRLKEIGDWLQVNGEAIYDTRSWADAPAYSKDSQLFFTRKGKDLYAIVTAWPTGPLVIPGVQRAATVSLLGWQGKPVVVLKNNALMITPPAVTPGTVPCQHAWVFKIQDAVIKK